MHQDANAAPFVHVCRGYPEHRPGDPALETCVTTEYMSFQAWLTSWCSEDLMGKQAIGHAHVPPL